MEKILMYLQGTVAIVITFGLAVFVHEFGHMMFALIRGVGVESFAIGMGPKITSWKWRGIDFSLRWFPVGGFVKLQGRTPPGSAGTPPETENAPEAAATPAAKSAPPAGAAKEEDKTLADSSYDDLYALQDKGFLTKVLVFGGGVFMNYVTAVLAITLMLLTVGIKEPLFSLKVDKVEPATVLAKTGLAPGDTIVAVNGQPVTYYNDLLKATDKELKEALKGDDKEAAARQADLKLALTVERQGQKVALPPQTLTPLQLDQFQTTLLTSIWQRPKVESVMFNKPAEKAGVKRGDLIVAVENKPIETYSQMVALLGPRVNQPTSLRVQRGNKTVDLTVTPEPGMPGLGQDPSRGYIGVDIDGSVGTHKDRIGNPFKALLEGQRTAIYRVQSIIKMNAQFFRHSSFKDVRENMTGPIGIAAITAKVAQHGFEEAVNWFVMLNLLLMIFNLLPLPVLDGGFILLAVIEAVIRRPVPPKVLAPIYTVFVVGFIILMVLISVQDIFNWVPRLLR